MNRSFRLFSCVCVIFVMIVCVSLAQAFDIGVYFDARSNVNWRCQRTDSLFCGSVSRDLVLNTYIGSTTEQQVFNWFHELGVNYIIPYYPFANDFTDLQQRELHGMKILNASYPRESFKYLEAQYRDLYVAYPDSAYTDPLNWTNTIAERKYKDAWNQYVLQCSTSVADTMYRPETELGIWNGWNWREACISGDTCMTMHYKIVCNLVPDGNTTETQPIATFYWLVREARDTNDDGNIDWYGWWRYPGKVLTVGDFSEPNRLDTIEFTIDPHPGASGTFVLLDDNFQPTDTTATSHAYGRNTLDETSGSHTFGTLWGVPVRMCIFYHGNNQTFQVYEVNVWDEGYHRLWVAPESVRNAYADTIRTAFQQQISGRDTIMAGWYFDEWPQTEQIKSYVRVNKIIQGYVPTMWTNGHFGWPDCPWCYRNILFDQMTSQQVTMPVHMEEFYFLGGRRTCDVNIQYMYTFPQSDTTYFHLIENCGSYKVLAEKSLQCAIDGYLWGWPTILSDSVPVNPDWLGLHGDLVTQIAFVHADPTRKFWAMIQGDDDVIGDSLDPTGNCVIRQPTPNECKLSAWLSVAIDADGILWYPVDLGGGLLHWIPDEADFCDNPNGLVNGPASVDTADRYEAAKEVCNEIKQIAPIFESLEFVKTYASRAYEFEYSDLIGSMLYPALQLDTLANESWYSQSYRCVESIESWAPSSHNQDTTAVTAWSANPEEDTYVQISRFRSRYSSPNEEDYWFLIVNRRALSHEFRKIRLIIEVNEHNMCLRRWADYILGDSMIVTESPGNREDCHPTRYLDVVLKPGEAQLVHFFRDFLPCDTALAHIHQLTALHRNDYGVNLNWEQVTQTDSGEAFSVDTFFVQASRYFDGPFATIGFSTTNSYIDTSVWSDLPGCFYQVQACGHIQYRVQSKPPKVTAVSVKK